MPSALYGTTLLVAKEFWAQTRESACEGCHRALAAHRAARPGSC
ncbi:hypothetical protein [Streptomyces roseoverticillatus]|nr:hypothetical protein [Streptomyces roseoverticillatus]